MKNKKILVAALAGITAALLKGYNALDEGELPKLEEHELPGLSVAIVKSLKREIAIIDDSEEFKGMTIDEIVTKKNEERAAELEKLQEMAADQLREMKARPTPEPEPEAETQEPEGEGDDEPDGGTGDPE